MMTPERWAQIKEIFAAVVEQPPGERQPMLANFCHDDDQLQAEVQRLLLQHDEMGGFLESTPAGDESSDRLLANGTVLAGRYRVVELLGSGGMGEVYEVEDLELGERVALKVIRQESAFDAGVFDRLRREVQLARRVTHPNVCRVFDLGRHQQQGRDYIFLTMELIKGETLSTRLKRTGKILPPEAAVIAVQLCHALDAAHQAGILHRDFKTGNVMLLGSFTPAGTVPPAGTQPLEQIRAVVTDFGIARLMRPLDNSLTPAPTGTLTHGVIAGTPAYMSPEQLLGEKLSPASDIYSLGLVLYEMVTGTRPFQGDSSWTETLKRLTVAPTAPVKIVPDLGERWNSTLLRCLQRDPQKRFQSASEVAETLTGRRRFLRSTSQRVLAATACFILLLVALGFAFRHRLWPALPEQKRLAILPFTFAGSEPANQAAAYELSESLTDNLSRMQASDRSLWVVPWLEVRNQKAQDAGHAASLLGANLVLLGELHRDSGKVGLLLQLKDAGSLRSLGSRTIDVPAAEVFTTEDKLLQGAADLLRINIPETMLHHLPVDETTEPGAYEFYQQGRGYLVHVGPANPDDLDRAITLFQEAAEKDPNFALAFANLALAYSMKFHATRDLQWLTKAKQTCAHALSLNDKSPYAHLALGAIDQEVGDLDGAIHEFQEVLRLDPTNDSALRHLSMAYDNSGRLLQAESLLKEAVKHGPGNFVNYNNLGFFYYQHAQYAQAEQPFKTAAELVPDNPVAFYNLGGVYLAEGKYKDAETILTRAIAIRPSAGAYSNLGTVRQYQGHYADAALMFQKATQLIPSDHRLWCNLGNAYELAGNKTGAEDAYKKAVELAQQAAALRPKDGELRGWLALYYAKLGEKSNAQKQLAHALSLSQNDPQLLFNSALIYELLGDREQALSALHSALQAGYSVSEVKSAPELAQLRQDLRFSGIIGNPGP
jgi:serine/threonine protein kinase/Flp pilus assembly protein TadD